MFMYTVWREAFLIWGIPAIVATRTPTQNWIDCHPAGEGVIPMIAGC